MTFVHKQRGGDNALGDRFKHSPSLCSCLAGLNEILTFSSIVTIVVLELLERAFTECEGRG